MAGRLFVVGLSWRTAPVALREKLAFAPQEIEQALPELLSSGAIDEAVIVSTCNRVEIYGATNALAQSSLGAATAEARSFLARWAELPGDDLADALYEKAEIEAIDHVFRVASALDSMVVGESQILGQVKDAYGAAVHCGATGPVLGRCLERAFGVAKRVRTETEVARGAANVSSVAVELAHHVFGELAGKSLLVVGAGKMSALAARHLRRAGATSILVTNRSFERAEELAAEIEGEARAWDELMTLLANADVVISSTGASEPVLTKGLVKKAMKRRRYRPVVMVDIAVPRDVEPSAGKIEGVYLFDIDDLRKVVDKNLRERSKEAIAAGRIVASEVEGFDRWLRSQAVVPTIRSLREHFAAVADKETEKVLAQLARDHTPQEREQAIRRLGRSIVNKLLHLPMTALKDQDGDVEALIRAAEELFRLESLRLDKTQDVEGEVAAEKAGEESRGAG